MCAMACEQIRWITESLNQVQSTDEDKRRFAEEVEKVRKAMAGVGKQAKGDDLQRVAELEESLKKLEEEMRPEGMEERDAMRCLEEKCEKKVTRKGRGETCGKGKGKGNVGK